MKPQRFLRMPLLAMLVFCLFSCNNATDESTTTTDSTTMDTMNTMATTAEATPSTVVTTPEHIMIVWHKVSNYSKWKASYEAHDSMRLANGLHSYVIGRSVKDSNMLLVAVKADDLEKAKSFSKNASLKAAMQKGGVVGTPKIKFTTVVYQDNAANMSDLRSMTTFTVKDWDAWKKSFEEHRQTRIDNGLTDRAYGYDADNNRNVTLVVGINDSTKAEAFWNSDVIKQRRAESGVVGKVDRVVYRVVQKY